MIFVDFTQASKGEARADAQAFKNFNALIAADLNAQRANEYFQGAPGRMAAINLESNRQVGLANTLAPDLNSIIQADVNQILGQAATRSVAGLTASATAQFTLPEIPALAQAAVDTRVASAENRQFQAETLVPQSQQIAQAQNTQTLSQQPTQFAYESGQNQFALDQQPQAQQIAAGTQQLQFDLQAREREYQLATQEYQQAILNGKKADLPTVQRLARAERNLNLLRTQAATTNQPLEQQVRNTQLTGQANRAITAEQIQDTAQDIQLADILFDETQLSSRQAIASLKNDIALGKVKFEDLNQEVQQKLQQDETQLRQHKTSLALKLVPAKDRIALLQSGVALADSEQAAKLAEYARSVNEIQAKNSVPAAEAAANEAKYKQQVFAGIRLLQGVTRYNPTEVPQHILAQTMKALQDNGLANAGDTMGSDPTGVFIRTAAGEKRPIAPMLNGLIREANPKATAKVKPPTYVWDTWVDSNGKSHRFVRATFYGPPTPEQIEQVERWNANNGFLTPTAGGATQGSITSANFIGANPFLTQPGTTAIIPQSVAPAVRQP